MNAAMNAAMNNATLADRNEIADLVSRLGMVLDEGRFDEMADLLVEDATVRTPGGAAAGRAALIAQARRNHRTDLNIQHVITNLLVDLHDDRADVRANLNVYFAPKDAPAKPAPPVQCTLGEVYRFAVVRTAAGWRFASVETIPVWMSGEVPTPVPASGS